MDTTKLKTLYVNHRKQILCVTVAVILIVAFALFSSTKYSTDILSGVFKKQTVQITQTLEKKVDITNKIISDNKIKIVDVDKRILKLEEEEKGVKNEISKIREPKNHEEFNKRASALGLTVTIK